IPSARLCRNGIAQEVPVCVDAGSSLRLRVRVHSRDGRVPVIGIGIARADGTPLYGLTTEIDGVRPREDGEKAYVAEIEFQNLALLPGAYTLKAHAADTEGGRLFDRLERGLGVRGKPGDVGLKHFQ